VQRLVLRRDEPPAEGLIVIRGGQMLPENLRRSAEVANREVGLYLISVFLVDVESLVAVCARPELRRYRLIRTSRVGEILASGFTLLATSNSPHYDIALPDLSDETLIRLAGCFRRSIINPAYGQ